MSFKRREPILALSFTALLSGGCTQTNAPRPVAAASAAPGSGITPSGFRMPEGAGCSGEIARYRAVIDNDVEIGHVARSVHGRIVADLNRASSACAAGRDAEAVQMVNATKSRFGYR